LVQLRKSGKKQNSQAHSCPEPYAASARLAAADGKAQLIFWSVTAAGLAADLWTKYAVFHWLQQKPHHSATLINGVLRFVMALNEGAAFGIATGWRHLLVIISLIALGAILAVFLLSDVRQSLLHIALALFAAGVCGNLWDRIFNQGCVRDFIDVVYWPQRHWPAFNLADSMLCVGVLLIIISGLRTSRQ